MEDTESAPKQTDQPPLKKTFWDILNSPFVLLLFSSFVVSGISFAYGEYSSYRKKSDDKGTQVSKLIAESKYRMDVISSMVQQNFTYTILFSANGVLLGDAGNKSPENKNIGNYSPIYQEFLSRNLVYLIWELQDMQLDKAVKIDLHRGIDAVNKLRYIWDNRIEMEKGVQPGTSDSIWRFRTTADSQDFDKNISIVRAALDRAPNPSRN